ncbi:MAG: tetraacyldisaccharide 4'-kinase [Planctomycetota bacterium]|nr:MAG: tetraacyldisaccharide 4'-kinase [Planctomycetota bacterium]
MAPALLRLALRAASTAYRCAVSIRNRRYDLARCEIHRPPVPVVSVGNLTVGGTGKTPMVEWLSRRLREQGARVAILSRGYGAEQGGLNDEALELELALADVPHLQNPDRAASAEIAVEELASQILVLDDAFQHRRLARDLDIVLLDASEPFGFGYLLPRGLLREPLAALARADVVVLSRADMIDAAARQAIRRRVESLAPRSLWCEVVHRPAGLTDSQGGAYPLSELQDKRVAAFCGIGNPAGFRHTLSALGCRLVGWREFPDHHDYDRHDVERLAHDLRQSGAELAVCTRKDLVKLRTGSLGGVPLRALAVELQFLEGEPRLLSALQPLVERARAVEPPWL